MKTVWQTVTDEENNVLFLFTAKQSLKTQIKPLSRAVSLPVSIIKLVRVYFTFWLKPVLN